MLNGVPATGTAPGDNCAALTDVVTCACELRADGEEVLVKGKGAGRMKRKTGRKEKKNWENENKIKKDKKKMKIC